jgi:hypothetical protein
MDDKKYAEGGFVDIQNICYRANNPRLEYELYYNYKNKIDSIKESFHLHKVIEIQQKFIDGKIDREEFDKQVKEESERYISVLKYRNQEIKCKMENDRISQALMEALKKN